MWHGHPGAERDHAGGRLCLQLRWLGRGKPLHLGAAGATVGQCAHAVQCAGQRCRCRAAKHLAGGGCCSQCPVRQGTGRGQYLSGTGLACTAGGGRQHRMPRLARQPRLPFHLPAGLQQQWQLRDAGVRDTQQEGQLLREQLFPAAFAADAGLLETGRAHPDDLGGGQQPLRWCRVVQDQRARIHL